MIVEVERLRRDFVVRHKTSRFGRSRDVVTAVADVTFGINAGECLGYIGANGAGKSTPVKMLMGILAVDFVDGLRWEFDVPRQYKKSATEVAQVLNG